MPEVLEVADRIQVMRLGTRVATLPSEGTTVEQLVGAMTGALGDQDHRNTFVTYALDGLENVLGLHNTEGRGGLIKEHESVGPSNGTHNGDLLTLPSRHRTDGSAK
jgi:ABC-type sugar transport system ATPase subunit